MLLTIAIPPWIKARGNITPQSEFIPTIFVVSYQDQV